MFIQFLIEKKSALYRNMLVTHSIEGKKIQETNCFPSTVEVSCEPNPFNLFGDLFASASETPWKNMENMRISKELACS